MHLRAGGSVSRLYSRCRVGASQHAPASPVPCQPTRDRRGQPQHCAVQRCAVMPSRRPRTASPRASRRAAAASARPAGLCLASAALSAPRTCRRANLRQRRIPKPARHSGRCVATVRAGRGAVSGLGSRTATRDAGTHTAAMPSIPASRTCSSCLLRRMQPKARRVNPPKCEEAAERCSA